MLARSANLHLGADPQAVVPNPRTFTSLKKQNNNPLIS